MAFNTAVQAVGFVANKAASLVFYAVMARELGQRGFGDFVFAASLVVLVELAGLGTDVILTRDVARDRRAIDREFWNIAALKLVLGSVAVAGAVAISFAGDYSGDVRFIVAVIGAAAVLEISAKTVHSTLRGIEDMAPIALGLFVQRGSTAVGGSVALLLGAGLPVVAIVYFGGALLGLLYVVAALLRRGIRPRRELSLPDARRLALASLPLGVSWILGALLARLDAVLLSFLVGNVAVGLYGAAYRIFEVMTLVGWTFGMATLPALSRLGRDTQPTLARAYETGSKVAGMVMLPAAVAFALFPEPLIQAMYGREFVDAASTLRLLAPATAAYAFFLLSSQVLAAQNRLAALAWFSGVALVVNLALNVVLIPAYEADGAAAAMSAAQVALSALMLVSSARLTGPVRWIRAVLSPTAGGAAMALSALVVGSGALGLLVAVAVYAATVLIVERSAFPDDFALLADTVRWRRLRAGAPAG